MNATEMDITRQMFAKQAQDKQLLINALQTFVDRATKLSGFQAAYDPYVGELVMARATLNKVRP